MGLVDDKPKAKKTETALEEVAAVLGKFDKLKTAIAGEVTGALAQAVQAYQQAAKGLSDAETAEALGREGADVKGATRRLAAARAELDRLSSKVKGLRAGLAGLGTELADAYDQLDTTLPEFYGRIRADFQAEWDEAVRAFSIALGKRAALESALGERLNLSEPRPAGGASLPAVAEPKGKLAALKGALGELRTWRAWESSTDPAGKPLAPLPGADPIYELHTAEDGLPYGSLVCEATFAPGHLRHLAASGLAVPATNAFTAQSLWTAELRLQAIEEQNRQRMADEVLRRERERPNFEHVYAQPYPDLTEEERKARMDPSNPKYQPVWPDRVEYVTHYPGTAQDKYVAPEPPMAAGAIE